MTYTICKVFYDWPDKTIEHEEVQINNLEELKVLKWCRSTDIICMGECKTKE